MALVCGCSFCKEVGVVVLNHHTFHTHPIVYDGPNSPDLKRILEDMYKRGAIVSAVCHGPCGLVSAVKDDGKSILDGHKVVGMLVVDHCCCIFWYFWDVDDVDDDVVDGAHSDADNEYSGLICRTQPKPQSQQPNHSNCR